MSEVWSSEEEGGGHDVEGQSAGKKRKVDVKAVRKERTFKSFAQRIAALQIDAFRTLEAPADEVAQHESYFHQHMQQVKAVFRGHHFVKFYWKTVALCRSLPLLLFHAQKMVKAVIGVLRDDECDAVSRKEIVRLVPMLARDLRSEFYPYFRDVFLALVEVMDPESVALLEEVFSAISHLLKYCQRQLLRDMPNVMQYYSLLLNHRKPHVRKFAAQSFAFLLRKLSREALLPVLQFLTRRVSEGTSGVAEEDGYAALLYETMRGFKGHLHSKAVGLVALVLQAAFSMEEGVSQAMADTLRLTMSKLAFHLRRYPDEVAQLWRAVLRSLESAKSAAERTVALHCFAPLVAGACRTEKKRAAELLQLVVTVGVSDVGGAHVVLSCVLQPLLRDSAVLSSATALSAASKLLAQMPSEALGATIEAVSEFRSSSGRLELGVLCYAGGALQELGAETTASVRRLVVQYLAAQRSEPYLRRFRESEQYGCVAQLLHESLRQSGEDALTCMLALSAVPLLNYVGEPQRKLRSSIMELQRQLAETTSREEALHHFMGAKALKALVALDAVEYKAAAEALEAHPNDPHYMAVFHEVVVVQHPSALEGNEVWQFMERCAAKLMVCERRATRAQVLDVLRRLPLELSGKNPFHLLYSAESTPLSSSAAGSVAQAVQRAAVVRCETERATHLQIRALFGSFHISVNPVWGSIRKALLSRADDEAFWLVLNEMLERVESILNGEKRTAPEAQVIAALDEVESHTPDVSLAQQLLRLLAEIPGHSMRVVQLVTPFFRHFLRLHYPSLVSNATSAAGASDAVAPETLAARSDVNAKKRLLLYLAVYASCKKAQQWPQSASLYQLFLRLLGHTDEEVQTGALNCILRWKDARLTPFKEHLRALTRNKSFKSAIAHSPLRDIVDQDVRGAVVKLVNVILFAKMFVRRGRLTLQQRRRLVLKYLNVFRGDELREFVDSLLAAFSPLLRAVEAVASSEAIPLHVRLHRDEVQRALGALSHRNIKGFLQVMPDVFAALRAKMLSYERPLVTIASALLFVPSSSSSTTSRADEMQEQAEREGREQSFPFRSQALRLLTQMVDAFPASNYAYSSGVIGLAIKSNLAHLAEQTQSGPNAVLRFLVRISRSPRFDYLLLDWNCVPQVLACLETSDLTSSTPRAVMEFVRNLLPDASLEVAEDSAQEGEPRFRRLLLPHLSLLIAHLQRVLVKRHKRGSRQASLGVMEFRLLRSLQAYVSDEQAVEVLRVVIPMLRRGRLPQETQMQVLQLFSELSANLRVVQLSEFLPALAEQFLAFREDRALLSALCAVYAALAQRGCVEVQDTADVLADMNAFSVVMVQSVDNGRRLSGLERAGEVLRAMAASEGGLHAHQTQWVPLLYSVLANLRSSDATLREAAMHSFTLFGRLLGEGGAAKGAHILDVAVLPFIKETLRTCERPLQLCAMMCLRHLVVVFPKRFADLQCLVGVKREEKDFFRSVYHVKKARRVQALQLLQKHVKSGAVQRESLTRFVLPALCRTAYETEVTSVSQSWLREVGKAVACIALSLTWKHYLQLLQQTLKQLERAEADRAEFLVHFACGVADSFHFTPESEGQLTFERIQGSIQDVLLPQFFQALREERSGELLRLPVAIAIVKLQRLLPERATRTGIASLCKQLCNSLASRQEGVRDATREVLAQVAVELGAPHFDAIVEGMRSSLLRGYQLQVFSFTLQFLLRRLREHLSVGALDHCMRKMVPVLLEDIFGESARKKEVSAIAARVKEAAVTKSYDSFTLLARIASFPHTFDALAEAQAHGRGFFALMQPMIDLLTVSSSARDRKRVREVFSRIAIGLAAHSELPVPSALVYCHSLISEHTVVSKKLKKDMGVQLLESARLNMHMKRVAALARTAPNAIPVQQKQANEQRTMLVERSKRTVLRAAHRQKDHWEENKHLVVEFALTVLHTQLKKKRVERGNQHHMEMLNPYVALLRRCLWQREDAVLRLTIKCLRVLVRHRAQDLPAIEQHIEPIVKRVMVLVGKVDPTSELAEACWRFLSHALRYCHAMHLGEAQLSLLLELVQQDLVELQHADVTFGLLRGIIHRRVLLPRLYDVMDRVQELAVSSHDDGARANCAGILVDFLLFFPLTKKALKQRLQRIVVDLGYSEVTGRESSLEMLNSIVQRFPEAVVQQHARMFFLGLALRFVNEQERSVRALLSVALHVLLEHAAEATRTELWEVAMQWLTQEASEEDDASGGEEDRFQQLTAEQRRLCAVQVLGVMVASEKGVSVQQRQELIASVVTRMEDVWRELEAHGDAVQQDELSAAPYDIVLYYGCVAIENALKEAPKAVWSANVFVAQCWSDEESEGSSSSCHLSRCLSYPHMWVRKAAVRILVQYLGAVSRWGEALHAEEELPVVLLGRVGNGAPLFRVIKLLCRVLSDIPKDEIDNDIAPLILQALLLLVTRLYQYGTVENAQVAAGDAAGGEADALQQQQQQQQQQQRQQPQPPQRQEEEEQELELHDNLDQRMRSVVWVFSRLSFIYRASALNSRISILKFFGAVLCRIADEDAAQVVMAIVNPVYRELSSSSFDEDSEIAQVCHKLVEVVKARIGVTEWLRNWNRVRESISRVRQQRRTQRKVDRVVRPEVAAARRLNKRRKRKEKKEVHKMKRKYGALAGEAQ